MTHNLAQNINLNDIVEDFNKLFNYNKYLGSFINEAK